MAQPKKPPLTRYAASGIALGLVVSLVLSSWVLAGIDARSRALAGGIPELLAGMVSVKASLAADFDRVGARFVTSPGEAQQLSARLADTSLGLASLEEDLPGAGDAQLLATREAIRAERMQFDALAEILSANPFSISTTLLERAKNAAATAESRLAQALRLAGVTVTGNDWAPAETLDEIRDISERLSDAARNTELSVESHTQSSVVIRWTADPIAEWAGIWLTVDGGEPRFVTDPTYVIEGLATAQAVTVVGSVALGEAGRYRGPATDALEAVAGDPPLAEAWLGDQSFTATFQILGITGNWGERTWWGNRRQRPWYRGNTDTGSITIDSSCQSGACSASFRLTGYDLGGFTNYDTTSWFYDEVIEWSSSSGLLQVQEGVYMLTIAEQGIGVLNTSDPCRGVGTRTIRFEVTQGAMVDGVWTATEISGSVVFDRSCGSPGGRWENEAGYLNTSLVANAAS